MKPSAARLACIVAMAAMVGCAQAPSHEGDPPAAQSLADARQPVHFPAEMRLHTLENMRDHLRSLEEIDTALAQGDYEAAAAVGERRLGMTSLEAHGASHLAPFMPEGMQQIGSQMHRAASRFAIAAQDAAVSNDPKPALAALAQVMRQCVACHSAYRLE